MWGVICGAVSSGGFTWNLENVLIAAACMLMSGPLLAGYTQTLNEYYDRDVDAINEPYRPIPSGAISLPKVVTQIWVLLIAGIAVAFGLDRWAGHEFPILTVLAIGGSFVSYIYSAPPLKLKQNNGWLSSYALGASYIALPWWAGHALFGELNWTIAILTLIYSLAGLGIAIVNDFKSVEGDRQLGLRSLPVMFGVTTAAWICVLMIDVFQAGIAGYLISIREPVCCNLIAAGDPSNHFPGYVLSPRSVKQRCQVSGERPTLSSIGDAGCCSSARACWCITSSNNSLRDLEPVCLNFLSNRFNL